MDLVIIYDFMFRKPLTSIDVSDTTCGITDPSTIYTSWLHKQWQIVAIHHADIIVVLIIAFTKCYLKQ